MSGGVNIPSIAQNKKNASDRHLTFMLKGQILKWPHLHGEWVGSEPVEEAECVGDYFHFTA